MAEQRTAAARPDPAAEGKALELAYGFAKGQLDAYAKSLVRVLPRHGNGDVFLGLALAALRRDARLIQATQANPASFIQALRECAYKGHVVTRGTFALVAYRNKNAPGGWEVTGIEEYRGVIERMFRAGGVQAVKVNVGRTNDAVLRFNPTVMDLPQHDYDEFAPPSARGPLKVAYAWAVMPGGVTSGVAWLPQHDIARRRATSRSGTNFWGPDWPDEGPNTEAMWKKSALHELEKFVPTTAEYRMDLDTRTELASAGQFSGMPPVEVPTDADYVDGEVVE